MKMYCLVFLLCVAAEGAQISRYRWGRLPKFLGIGGGGRKGKGELERGMEGHKVEGRGKGERKKEREE